MSPAAEVKNRIQGRSGIRANGLRTFTKVALSTPTLTVGANAATAVVRRAAASRTPAHRPSDGQRPSG